MSTITEGYILFQKSTVLALHVLQNSTMYLTQEWRLCYASRLLRGLYVYVVILLHTYC